MIQANYHTHTERCQHAIGSDEEFVINAIKGGYQELGFSDHCPWNYATDYVSDIRMKVSEFSGYVRSLRLLKEKYKDQINIKIGMECEFFTDYIPWLKETVREAGLDYLIFGNHFYDTDEKYPYFGRKTNTPEMLEMYIESSIRGMESGLFAYLAHPDLFMRCYPTFDSCCEKTSRIICRTAAKLHLPLEYNLGCLEENLLNKITGYPHPSFWQIAKDEGCTAIIGMDAHERWVLANNLSYAKAITKLNQLGIKIIDRI